MAVTAALFQVNGYAQADTNRNGLTIEELQEFVGHEYARRGDYEGYLREDPVDDDIEPQLFSPTLFTWMSPDFELAPYSAPIPEPSAFLLAMIGLSAVGFGRWR